MKETIRASSVASVQPLLHDVSVHPALQVAQHHYSRWKLLLWLHLPLEDHHWRQLIPRGAVGLFVSCRANGHSVDAFLVHSPGHGDVEGEGNFVHVDYIVCCEAEVCHLLLDEILETIQLVLVVFWWCESEWRGCSFS